MNRKYKLQTAAVLALIPGISLPLNRVAQAETVAASSQSVAEPGQAHDMVMPIPYDPAETAAPPGGGTGSRYISITLPGQGAPPKNPAQPPPAPARLEPLPKEWECPADPGKWFDRRSDEIIETEQRWQEYLKVSGFKPPEPVDFKRCRVALFTFIGGGGSYLMGFEASRRGQEYTLTMITTPGGGGEGMVSTQDIVYDCRLFVVPRKLGKLSLGYRSSDPRPGPAKSKEVPGTRKARPKNDRDLSKKAKPENDRDFSDFMKKIKRQKQQKETGTHSPDGQHK